MARRRGVVTSPGATTIHSRRSMSLSHCSSESACCRPSYSMTSRASGNDRSKRKRTRPSGHRMRWSTTGSGSPASTMSIRTRLSMGESTSARTSMAARRASLRALPRYEAVLGNDGAPDAGGRVVRGHGVRPRDEEPGSSGDGRRHGHRRRHVDAAQQPPVATGAQVPGADSRRWDDLASSGDRVGGGRDPERAPRRRRWGGHGPVLAQGSRSPSGPSTVSSGRHVAACGGRQAASGAASRHVVACCGVRGGEPASGRNDRATVGVWWAWDGCAPATLGT